MRKQGPINICGTDRKLIQDGSQIEEQMHLINYEKKKGAERNLQSESRTRTRDASVACFGPAGGRGLQFWIQF